MASLASSILILLKATLTGTQGSIDQVATVNKQVSIELANADADLLYSAAPVIAGGVAVIDLAGSLEDALGNAIVFDKVMMLFIQNGNSSGANPIIVSTANNIPILNGDTDSIVLAPGAAFLYVDENGIDVGAASSDLVSIAGTNDDTFDIIVFGKSA